ncbi:hypothetical protein M413DRAFT_26773 [Hebeloma cylindrosporum]|uniref:Uncharacterized protein n=1 Tax=Hebeloma cylindrosporum TaxID=76867 RepID=A0A0C2XYS8_HEBCY|nr:hypothetical protein M413DRAFT_26773 [Hebeloma cylindrosporum h7]
MFEISRPRKDQFNQSQPVFPPPKPSEAPARLNTETHRAGVKVEVETGPGTAETVGVRTTMGAIKEPNNLCPGYVAPPGHVWHPSTGGGPSHVGAPGHLSEAEKRHPSRPQDLEHYKQQKLQEAQAAEAKRTTAASGAHKGLSKYLPKQTKALEEFEKKFPARHGGAAGRAHEAPGRMQTSPVKTPVKTPMKTPMKMPVKKGKGKAAHK